MRACIRSWSLIRVKIVKNAVNERFTDNRINDFTEKLEKNAW